MIIKYLTSKIFFFISCLKDETKYISRCDILFFCHDVDRNLKFKNKNFSPLIDTLSENLKKKGFVCQSISFPISILKSSESFNNPIVINRSFMIARFLTFLSRYFFFLKRYNKRNFFKKIIKNSSAKIIITIGVDEDLCYASRKENIFIIELLHFIGLTSIPKAYDWINKDKNLLPNAVLSIDAITTKTFNFLKKKNIQIKTIPHPFLHNTSIWKKNLNYQNIDLKKLGFFNYKTRVIITLSWVYALDCKDYSHLNNILKNELFYDGIQELVDSEKDIFWSFRLHPLQIKLPKYSYQIKYLENFIKNKKNVEFKIISKLPLLEALNLHDCHLQMFSSTCYEAAVLGIKSLILCPSVMRGGLDQQRYNDLVKEGYAQKIYFEKKKVVNWVRNTKKIDPRGQNKKNNLIYEQCLNWILNKGNLS
jgi:hypothetical protein